jgi:uncharacterized membrane protein YfcA
VFGPAAILVGLAAALVVGMSKSALPGAALIATPLFALVVSGRQLPGVTLPVLLFADVFAVVWFHRHTRWDLLRPLAVPVAAGFVAGGVLFVSAGSDTRALEVAIGLSVVTVVLLQVWRTVRRAPPRRPTTAAAIGFGTSGGFTTFVANTAGPIINSYLIGLGLDRHSQVATNAWFYFAVNVAKVPCYVAIGELTAGGRFFSVEGLLYDLVLLPAVLVGLFTGRSMLHRLPEVWFLWLVLALSFAGGVKLLVW